MFDVLFAIVSAIWRVNVNSANALLNCLIAVPERGSEAVEIRLALEEAIIALLSVYSKEFCFSPPFFAGICISAFLSCYVSGRLRYFFNKDPLITNCLSLCLSCGLLYAMFLWSFGPRSRVF